MSAPHTVLVRWTKARPRLIASLGGQKATCEGPAGQLDCILKELLQWIFARLEQGIAVTMPHVVYKASSTLRHQQEAAFKDKVFEARLGAATCFLAKYDFVYRTKTNEATSEGVQGGGIWNMVMSDDDDDGNDDGYDDDGRQRCSNQRHALIG